jgi:hypothetical protein
VSDLQSYKENILNFGQFMKKAIPVMEVQKQQLKRMIETREQQNTAYAQIVAAVTKYEDNNIEYYSESDVSRKIVTNPVTGTEFVDRYQNQIKSLKNPFKEGYYWLKGELLDLKGLQQAMAGRDAVVSKLANAENKKRSDIVEHEKLSQGKTTLKSLFKSKSGKETEMANLQNIIDATVKDIEDYKKLIDFLTVYHG